jgi:hypothetical protein
MLRHRCGLWVMHVDSSAVSARPLHPNQQTSPALIGSSESCQGTKSLRSSPLRGGKSREAVAR